MKIGILQCDSPLPPYKTQFGDYPDMFIELFRQIQPQLRFTTYNVEQGQYPSDINDCDAYITTGSKAGVYDELEWISTFRQFILTLHQHKKTLVGICFGHQLIADTLGGKAEKSDKGWGIGVHEHRIAHHEPWMQPGLHSIKMIVSHKDQVTRLPTHAIRLAGSEFCPNAAYAIEDHILCFQGHPEFSHDYSRALMIHRRELFGETLFQQGIHSLAENSDELDVTRWILNFIHAHHDG
jgi:GMP synthase-like glutamine amidotransferase